MTYDLSKGHQRSLGVGGGLNKTAALIMATLATAVIAGVWASILRVDPARLTDINGVWPALGLQAFPALVVIVGLFLLPLYFMILRPAGQKDPTLAILTICGAGTLSMLAGLIGVSAPRERMAYDVFQIENAYVGATLKDMNALEGDLRAAGVLRSPDDPPPANLYEDGVHRIRLFGAKVEERADAFETRRRKVRVDLAARLGPSRAGRERLVVFDQQAAKGERLVEKFWALHIDYARQMERYAEVARKAEARGDFASREVWAASHAVWETERDIGRLHESFRDTPFLNRSVRWPTRPTAPVP
ncbi:MAG: hypothetical protein KF842_08300 [Caulobacter sp.]|nr:hypothetical protein [Caulobacter sp.]